MKIKSQMKKSKLLSGYDESKLMTLQLLKTNVINS